MSAPDTIAAVATPPGRGGVGVIRVSGGRACDIAKKVTGKTIQAGQHRFSDFRDNENNLIDKGLCLYFQCPHSYTGEDVVEFQTHGSDTVLQMLLQTCIFFGARMAKPGEFTERAFLNNKLDLVQAEAVADLIESRSQQAARSALRSLEGKFSEQVHDIHDEIVQAKSLVEAGLDFPDEGDIQIDIDPVKYLLKNASIKLKQIVKHAENGQVLNRCAQIVIAGEPNVGKSSLLNRLTGNDTAIVSDVAGTTRDTIKQNILLEGIELTLIDTAGIRKTDDVIEREGVRRTTDILQKADLILYVADKDNFVASESLPEHIKTITIRNKIDIYPDESARDKNVLHLSVKTGEGFADLIEQIKQSLFIDHHDENAVTVRQRHIDALVTVTAIIDDTVISIESNEGMELAGEQLRLALLNLDEVLGKVTSDDILGEIFSRFCVGK